MEEGGGREEEQQENIESSLSSKSIEGSPSSAKSKSKSEDEWKGSPSSFSGEERGEMSKEDPPGKEKELSVTLR